MELIEIIKDGNNFVPVEIKTLLHCIESRRPFQFIYYSDKDKKEYTKFSLHFREIDDNVYTYINSITGKFIIEVINNSSVLIKRETFVRLAA